MNKKVTVFTTFSDIQKAYSLNIIAQSQIKMLLMNGYDPTVIVHDGFKPEGIYAHPGVTIKEIPNVPCHNELRKDETFDQDVDLLEKELEVFLKDQDVVLTHDVIYQNACLKHNFASHRLAKKLPKLKWLHWIHSATSPLLLNMLRPIFVDEYINLVSKPFPNAFYVYPNSHAVPSVATNFGINQEFVKVVHHATDICSFFGMPEEVEEIIYKKNIFSADAITTYPIRLDRGKQVEYVIKTAAMLKDFDQTVRIIIIDFHSTAGDKVTYRDELKEIGIDYGLNSDELTFLTEEREEWKYEVPQTVVANFQQISNFFILPSVSETYSLIAQEAALTKQVMVFNHDFPPFRSIYGENAIYRKFSSRMDVMADPTEALTPTSETNTKYGSPNLPEEARGAAEKEYHRYTAGLILNRLKHPEVALSTYLRKNRNLQAVFKNELEPLFFEN